MSFCSYYKYFFSAAGRKHIKNVIFCCFDCELWQLYSKCVICFFGLGLDDTAKHVYDDIFLNFG